MVQEISPDLLDEVFANPPLVEVAFEVRFPPLLKVERHLPDFQEKIAIEYPLLRQKTLAIDNQETDSFEFKTSDQLNTIRTTLRSFGFVSRKYDHFEGYKAELEKYLGDFCTSVGITKFNRVGLRYINNIPLAQKNGIYSIRDFVHPLVDTERINLETLSSLKLQLIQQLGPYQLAIRAGLVPIPKEIPGTPAAVYLLDYDCFVLNDTALSDTGKLLDDFHGRIQRQFLQDVTSEYVEIMRRKEG